MSRRAQAIAAAYGLAAIFTFGHAQNGAGMVCNETLTNCALAHLLGSLIAGASWPLYWSWVAWS